MQGAQTRVTVHIANPWTTGLTKGRAPHKDNPGPYGYAWRAAADGFSAGATRNVYSAFSKILGSYSYTDSEGKQKNEPMFKVFSASKRPSPDKQWIINSAYLSEEGLLWAKEAAEGGVTSRYSDTSGFDKSVMNASDIAPNGKGPVALAIASFTFDPTKMDYEAVRNLARRLEDGNKGLYPLAAALRIAHGGQYLTKPRNQDAPFLARSPRIDDKTVTGREGVTITVPGLARRTLENDVTEIAPDDVRARATALLPAKSFKAVVTVPGRTLDDPDRQETYRPFDYQKVGIAFALMNDGKALIGDEMGLGKTVQALGFLSVNPNPLNDRPSLPALIVCPGSVETNWVKEAKRWLPKLKAQRYESGKTKLNTKHDIMVTSWDMITLYPEFFQAQGYMTVIADEMHYAKRLRSTGASKNKFKISVTELLDRDRKGATRKSWAPYVGRTAALMLLSRTIPNRILMTGTPFANANPMEIWPALNILDPETFPDAKSFAREYLPIKRQRSVVQSLGMIQHMAQSYMVRRIKQMVADQTGLGDLVVPGQGRAKFGATKRNVTDVLTLTKEQKQYREAFNEGMTELIRSAQWAARMESAITAIFNLDPTKGETAADVVDRVNEMELDPEKTAGVGLAVQTYSRQFIGELKVPNAAQWIKQKVEVERKPVVVWVYHKNVAAAMEEVLKTLKITVKGKSKPVRYALINSKNNNTAKAKGKIVDMFQNGDLDVVVGTESMAEGVTLTRANEALFVEYWWMPGKLTQAEDRIFRVGQKEDCIITTLHAPGPVVNGQRVPSQDDLMADKLNQKNAILDRVAGLDQYESEDVSSRLAKAQEWMVKIILDRLVKTIADATLLPDEITLADVEDALSDNPKNIIEVYVLEDDYRDESIFGSPTSLLIPALEVEDFIDQIPKFKLTPARQAVLDALLDAPVDTKTGKPTINRLDLIVESGQSTKAVDKIIGEFSGFGVASAYDAPDGIPPGSKREEFVRSFQKAGGSLSRAEMGKLMKRAPAKDQLASMVAEKILKLTRKPKVRMNPRRPGQMIVNGQLPVLPFNALDSLAFGDVWEPGTPKAREAERNRKAALDLVRRRVRNAMRTPRGKLPSLRYAHNALAHYIRMPKTKLKAYLPDAFACYNRLHATAELHRKAGERVPRQTGELLRRAHKILVQYED